MSDILGVNGDIHRLNYIFEVDRDIREYEINDVTGEYVIDPYYIDDCGPIANARKRLSYDILETLNREQYDRIGDVEVEFVVRARCKGIDRAAGLDGLQLQRLDRMREVRTVRIAL